MVDTAVLATKGAHTTPTVTVGTIRATTATVEATVTHPIRTVTVGTTGATHTTVRTIHTVRTDITTQPVTVHTTDPAAHAGRRTPIQKISRKPNFPPLFLITKRNCKAKHGAASRSTRRFDTTTRRSGASGADDSSISVI